MSGVPARITWAQGIVGDTQAVADHDTTRYLCAAAHLNPSFARRAVRELLVAEQRFPAAVHPVDLVTVARHCIAARSRRLYLDIALCAIVLIAAAFSPWAVLAWGTWLAGLWLLLRGVREAGGSAGGMVLRLVALMWAVTALVVVVLAVTNADPFGIRSTWHLALPGPDGPLRWVGVPAAAILCCWLAVSAEEASSYLTVTERLRR